MTSPVLQRARSEFERTFGVVYLGAVAMWLPMIVGRILVGQPAMSMLLFGALVGFLNTAIGGRKVGALAALALVLIGASASESPVRGSEQRVLFTLIGCVLALVGILVMGLTDRWSERSEVVANRS